MLSYHHDAGDLSGTARVRLRGPGAAGGIVIIRSATDARPQTLASRRAGLRLVSAPTRALRAPPRDVFYFSSCTSASEGGGLPVLVESIVVVTRRKRHRARPHPPSLETRSRLKRASHKPPGREGDCQKKNGAPKRPSFTWVPPAGSDDAGCCRTRRRVRAAWPLHITSYSAATVPIERSIAVFASVSFAISRIRTRSAAVSADREDATVAGAWPRRIGPEIRFRASYERWPTKSCYQNHPASR